MRPYLFFPLCLLLAVHSAPAQRKAPAMPFLLLSVLDTASLQATYSYTCKYPEQKQVHLMSLLIGEQVQLFQGMDEYYQDSLGLALENKAYDTHWLNQQFNKLPKGASSILWQVYTGYPQGHITITDRVLMDTYKSEELVGDLPWHLHPDSVQEIGGYPCQLATLELYGRHWSAWYTPEIAYASGPWILRGLPGLIVQAYDSERLHDFLLLSIAERKHPIAFRESTYFKYPRERVIREYMKYASDPGRAFQSAGLATPLGDKKNAPPIKRTIPYIPLRRVTP